MIIIMEHVFEYFMLASNTALIVIWGCLAYKFKENKLMFYSCLIPVVLAPLAVTGYYLDIVNDLAAMFIPIMSVLISVFMESFVKINQSINYKKEIIELAKKEDKDFIKSFVYVMINSSVIEPHKRIVLEEIIKKYDLKLTQKHKNYLL